jgi:tricorn protease-like protein
MQEDIGQIRVAHLHNGIVNQLTEERRGRYNPSLSPDNNRIAFAAQDFGYGSFFRNIYFMDKDGGNTKKLTDDSTYKMFPSWSPDEKWIAYVARPVSEPPDSTKVFLIQTDILGKPRLIGYGRRVEWLNAREFLLWRPSATYKGSIDRAECEKFSEDSIRAHPAMNGKNIVFEDLHKGRQGVGITTISSFIASGTRGAKQLYPGIVRAMALSQNDLFVVLATSGELRRISLSDGMQSAVKTRLPWFSSAYDFTVSADGNELVYIDAYWTSNFSIIDNLFK